eukprot:3769418-Rhodomonas_salina.1
MQGRLRPIWYVANCWEIGLISERKPVLHLQPRLTGMSVLCRIGVRCLWPTVDWSHAVRRAGDVFRGFARCVVLSVMETVFCARNATQRGGCRGRNVLWEPAAATAGVAMEEEGDRERNTAGGEVHGPEHQSLLEDFYQVSLCDLEMVACSVGTGAAPYWVLTELGFVQLLAGWKTCPLASPTVVDSAARAD